MNSINPILVILCSKINDLDRKNTNVSKSSVGWHIEHSLKTIDLIITACKKSDPSTYQWKFKLNRFLILDVLQKIPRGKGKAPKVVQPEGDMHENCYFFHPYFGNLNKKATEKFLALHTNHHLKIIEDICN